MQRRASKAGKKRRPTRKERDRDQLKKRVEDTGGCVVFHGAKMFVVVIAGASVRVATEKGKFYASGIWRALAYVHWENERALDWRLLDKIDLALRRKARSNGGLRAFRPTRED